MYDCTVTDEDEAVTSVTEEEAGDNLSNYAHRPFAAAEASVACYCNADAVVA